MQTLTKNWLNSQTSDASLTSFTKWLPPWHKGRITCDTAWRLVLSMKPWSYIWLEFGLFLTIIAIIRACACWALFVVTLTNTVHLIYIYTYILKLLWYIYIFPMLFVWATPIVDFHTSSLSSSVILFTVIPNVLAFEHGWIFIVSTVPLKVWPNIRPSLCLSLSVAWMLHRPWYLVTWFILSIFNVCIISQNLFPFLATFLWHPFCQLVYQSIVHKSQQPTIFALCICHIQ